MAGQQSAAPAEEQSEPTTSETSEKTSVFIPKEALGGRDLKVGDSLDFLKVQDIDPDTGEVEAAVEDQGSQTGKTASTNDAIDNMQEG